MRRAPEPSRPQGGGDSAQAPLYAKLKPGPGHSAQEVREDQLARLQGAMIELVAERGFDAVTVRGLSHLAGISSTTFYKHFDNAEECFCSTYDGLMGRGLRGAASARDGAEDWEECLRASLRSVMGEVAREPKAASVALIGAVTAGPGMLGRMRAATAEFERFLVETFARAPEPIELPPRIVQGITAGTARVIRARLLAGRAAELPGCADQLADWMLSFRDQGAAELERLGSALDHVERGGRGEDGRVDAGWLASIGDERARILAAVARLGQKEGYWRLTVPKIRAEAEVSRRGFDAQFKDVGDCFVQASQALVVAASAEAERQSQRAESWERGVYRAALVLCEEIARSPVIAQLGFADLFAPGRDGLRCREELVGLGARTLRRMAPAGHTPGELVAEASMAATWRIAYEEIVAGRAERLPRVVPTLAYMTLAPVIGADSALRAIRAEQEGAPERPASAVGSAAAGERGGAGYSPQGDGSRRRGV